MTLGVISKLYDSSGDPGAQFIFMCCKNQAHFERCASPRALARLRHLSFLGLRSPRPVLDPWISKAPGAGWEWVGRTEIHSFQRKAEEKWPQPLTFNHVMV